MALHMLSSALFSAPCSVLCSLLFAQLCSLLCSLFSVFCSLLSTQLYALFSALPPSCSCLDGVWSTLGTLCSWGLENPWDPLLIGAEALRSGPCVVEVWGLTFIPNAEGLDWAS